MPDKNLRGIAVDLEVNQYLDQRVMESMPFRPILLQDYAKMKWPEKAGALKYYELLREAKDNKQKSAAKGEGKDGKGTTGDEKLDELLENHKDFHEWLEGLSDAEKEMFKKQIVSHLKQCKDQCRGNVPKELEDILKMYLTVKPSKIPWASYVRRLAGTVQAPTVKKTRRRENIRFTENKGSVKKKLPHIAWCIDESGSMSDEDITEMNNELYHLYRNGIKIDIIHWSMGISKISEYNGSLEFERVSCGGTEVSPIIEHLNKEGKYSSVFIATDGYIESNPTDCRLPLMWIITTGGTENFTSRHPKVKLN